MHVSLGGGGAVFSWQILLVSSYFWSAECHCRPIENRVMSVAASH